MGLRASIALFRFVSTLFMLLGVTCVEARALESLGREDIVELNGRLATRWAVSGLKSKKVDAGIIESRSFDRYVTTVEHPFLIGNITYIKIPASEGNSSDYEPDNVFKTIKEMMGIDRWSRRVVGKSVVYEGYWAKKLRYLRIFLTHDGDAFSVSVANFRVVYMESADLEIELIQRRLAGGAEAKLPGMQKMFSILDGWFLDRAFAQTLPGGNPSLPSTIPGLPTGASGTCAPGDAACQAAQTFNQAGSTIDKSINTKNGTITLPNGDVVDIPQNSQEDFNKGVAAVDKIGDKMDRTNANAERGLDLAEKRFNKKYIAEMAFLASVAATSGAIVVGAAATALSAAVNALWEAITQTEEKKQRLERFKAARKFYEEHPSEAEILQGNIDRMMRYFDLAKGLKRGREGLVSMNQIQIDKDRIQDKLTVLEKQKAALLEDPNMAQCVDQINAKRRGLKAEFEFLETFEKYAGLNPKAEDFCAKIIEEFQSLAELEGLLEGVRAAVIAGIDEALEDASKQDEQTKKDFDTGKKIATQLKKNETERAYKAAESNNPDYFKTKEAQAFVGSCLKKIVGKTGYWLSENLWLIGKIWSPSESQVRKCRESYYVDATGKNSPAKQRIDAVGSVAQQTVEAGKYLRPNDEIQRLRRSKVLEIYNRSVIEQVCLNKAPDCRKGAAPLSSTNIVRPSEVACCYREQFSRYANLTGSIQVMEDNLRATCGMR